MGWPFSNALGASITIAFATVVLIALFTTGLGPILLGGAIVAALLYISYIAFINVHRWSTTLYERRRRQ